MKRIVLLIASIGLCSRSWPIGAAVSGAADLRCGAYCLYVALRAIDAPVSSLPELQSKLGPPGRGGYSLGQLQDAAKEYGVFASSVHTSLERLAIRKRPFAIVAHLDEGHFINIVNADLDDVYIIDPPSVAHLSPEALASRWSGNALLVSTVAIDPEESLRARSSWYQRFGWALIGLAILLVAWKCAAQWRARSWLVCASIVVCSGCSAESPESQATGRIRVFPRVVELGEVPLTSTKLSAAITLENVGRSELSLRNVLTSCSCLVVESPLQVLQPGETTSLVVQVQLDQPGENARKVHVFSSDPEMPRADISISWNAIPRVAAETEFVDFGAVLPGATATRSVQIMQADSQCVPGHPETQPDGGLSAVMQTVMGQHRLVLALKAGSDVGTNVRTVRIPIEGCDTPPIKVRVQWEVRDVVMAVPPRCSFGSVLVGSAVERNIRIVTTSRRVAIQNLTVTGIPDCVATARHMGDETLIRLEWTPSAAALVVGVLTARFSEPEAVAVSIPISGVASFDSVNSK